MKPFTASPDRAAAISERMAREAKARRVAEEDRLVATAAKILEEAVEQGLGWGEIRERLRSIR